MAYNAAKIVDYSRINSETGCGFILRRLANVPHTGMTRKEVYEGSRYNFRPGYHCSLWAKMMEDGLIEPDGGFKTVKCAASYWSHTDHCDRAQSAWKNVPPTYFITEKGLKIVEEMHKREMLKPSIQKTAEVEDEFYASGCKEDCSHCELPSCVQVEAEKKLEDFQTIEGPLKVAYDALEVACSSMDKSKKILVELLLRMANS